MSGLIFDAGSHTFRVGFAGEEYPKVRVFVFYIYLMQISRNSCKKATNWDRRIDNAE